MKVYLKKDIERIGMAGEIIKVKEGFAKNYLIPKGLAAEISDQIQIFLKNGNAQ